MDAATEVLRLYGEALRLAHAEQAPAAEAKVSLAEGLLEEAVGLLRGVGGNRKAERVLEFLEKTEERLQEVEENATGSPLVLGATVLGAAFKNAKALPNKIRALIQSWRLESAMDELDALGDLVDDAGELVEQLLEEEEDQDDDEDETDEETRGTGKPEDKVRPENIGKPEDKQ